MSKPLVSVIIATYLEENDTALDYCIKSLDRQTYENIEIILVSSNRTPPSKTSRHPIKTFASDRRLHYPEAVSIGRELVSREAKYIQLLNDDCFLTDRCIETMVNVLGDNRWMLNPMSNCDFGFFHVGCNGFFSEKEFIQLPRQMTMSDVIPIYERAMTHPIGFPDHVSFTAFSPFYASLMTKEVYDELSGPDPLFQTGLDDLDMSLRGRKIGIRSGIILSAYAIHLSGASATSTLTDENRHFNTEYFKSKHGYYPDFSQWVK